MTDQTYSRIKAERILLKAVDADPRVVAALEAKNAFFDSDAGYRINEAIRGRETWAALDEDIKDAFEAFIDNYVRTRRLVKAELLTQIRAQEKTTK